MRARTMGPAGNAVRTLIAACGAASSVVLASIRPTVKPLLSKPPRRTNDCRDGRQPLQLYSCWVAFALDARPDSGRNSRYQWPVVLSRMVITLAVLRCSHLKQQQRSGDGMHRPV